MSEKGVDSELKQKSKRALTWDFVGTIFRQLASFGVSILLARILGPEDFGLIGIALVFIAVGKVFVEGGFTAGIIQKQKVSEEEYSSIFYINIAFGFAFSILLFAIAPFIAGFYDKNEVEWIIRWLALVPLLASFSTVHAAKLEKSLELKSIVKISFLATIISGLLGVVSAFLGFGVISLIIQQISFTVLRTLFLWIVSAWIPRLVFRFEGIKQIISFSAYVFFDRLIRTIFLNLDTLFVAKIFSPITLGYYSRASSLTAQVNGYATTSVSRVIFPLLSKLQNNNTDFENILFKVIGMISVVLAYVTGVLFFLASPIIIGLLGDKWFESIIIFKILLFNVFFMAPRSILIKAFLSKGLSKIGFKIGLFQRLFRLLPLVIGLYSGIFYFTVSIVIVSGFLTLMQGVFIDKFLGYSWFKLFQFFFMPITPLIAIIGIQNLFHIDINLLVLTSVFIVLETVFLYSIKNEGFFHIQNLLKQTFILLLNRVRNN